MCVRVWADISCDAWQVSDYEAAALKAMIPELKDSVSKGVAFVKG